MGLFAQFVDRVWTSKLDRLAASADRAGQAGKARAQQLVRVKTGRLQRSIGYYVRRDGTSISVTLYAGEPYAFIIERRFPYLRPAREVMKRIFTGGSSDIQFETLAPKYQAGARQVTGGSPRTIIGHRARRPR